MDLQETLKDVDELSTLIIRENPFENDIVIGLILSFLKTKEVKTCRFLNKQWNNLCWRRILQQTPPYALGLSDLCEEKHKEVLTLIENNFPLAQRVSITSDFLEDVEENGNLLRVFNALAPNLTDLELDIDTYEDGDQQMSYPEGLTIPNLTRLSLHMHSSNSKYFGLALGIIKNSPLVDISISIDVYGLRKKCVQRLVNVLTKTEMASRLRTLELDMRKMSNAQYNLMAGAGLKLRMLRVTPVTLGADGVMRFLESQSESLEHLQICFKDNMRAHFKIPDMAKLKVLELLGLGQWKFNESIHNGISFPALERLEFKGVYLNRSVLDSYLHFGRSQGDIGRNLRTLKFSFISELMPLRSENIENAAYLFPNLTKLEVPAELGILKKVFVGMRKLQELKLNCQYNQRSNNGYRPIDNLLMGVQPGREDDFETSFNRDESLLALTELRSLRIKSLRK